MDAGAHKLLETIILKTLHAHNFTRSSTQASLALTDLLSQYLVLLATTCSQYAQHAGRLNLSVRDAMSALDELGVSMDRASRVLWNGGRRTRALFWPLREAARGFDRVQGSVGT